MHVASDSALLLNSLTCKAAKNDLWFNDIADDEAADRFDKDVRGEAVDDALFVELVEPYSYLASTLAAACCSAALAVALAAAFVAVAPWR